MQEFASFVFTPGTNIPKPVFIVVDGGPDENPRFMKTISVAIHNFKIMNFDALFVCSSSFVEVLLQIIILVRYLNFLVP